MNELEVLYKVMSFYNLSTIFIPLTIVFLYILCRIFSIYVVYRVNNALKLVSIYYLKLFVLFTFCWEYDFTVVLMSNMMAVTSVDVNYPLLFCIQLFASVLYV